MEIRDLEQILQSSASLAGKADHLLRPFKPKKDRRGDWYEFPLSEVDELTRKFELAFSECMQANEKEERWAAKTVAQGSPFNAHFVSDGFPEAVTDPNHPRRESFAALFKREGGPVAGLTVHELSVVRQFDDPEVWANIQHFLEGLPPQTISVTRHSNGMCLHLKVFDNGSREGQLVIGRREQAGYVSTGRVAEFSASGDYVNHIDTLKEGRDLTILT